VLSAASSRLEGSPRRLAFVVPRYGVEIVGGAETLARGFAERLPRDRFDVEVWTTCARDHHTWANAHEPGATEVNGVVVRRFPVSARDVHRFLAVQERLSLGFPLSTDEEIDWLAGSVHSEGLYDWIAAHAAERDALLFLPYLFGTTLVGAHVAPERSILVPCLHDEPFAYLAVTRHLFRSVRGTIFNSAPERALAQRLHGVAADAPVVGFGFDEEAPAAREGTEEFRRRHGIGSDYLLYFGRKEEGKNLPLLLAAFRACRDAGAGLSLVVAGDGSIPESARPRGVIDLPRLDEADKRVACAGALALCQPSVNESFSIVIMEAWQQETPVLVNAACAVTRRHTRESGGGLEFADAIELAACVDHLRANPDDARALGRNGREYVREQYAWPVVIERFAGALDRILGGTT
jgi:glycosyltransferase involved in cell wall biosynthesis